MKPTNEERRKVAKDLRMLASLDRDTRGAFSETVGETVAVTMGIADFEDFADVLERFADLIEPEPERTCSAEERYYYDDSSPWPYYACSECGERIQCREVVEADGDQYYEIMPYCAGCGAKVADE